MTKSENSVGVVTWRSVVVGLMTALFVVVCWGFSQIAEMPDKYAKKEEVKNLSIQIGEVQKGVNEINMYLRDH